MRFENLDTGFLGAAKLEQSRLPGALSLQQCAEDSTTFK
jgi:hypothetical protein